jgi:hypothetical protein
LLNGELRDDLCAQQLGLCGLVGWVLPVHLEGLGAGISQAEVPAAMCDMVMGESAVCARRGGE